MEGLLGVGSLQVEEGNVLLFAGGHLGGEFLVAGEEGMPISVFDNLVQNKYEINSLIIVLVVFGQNCRVLLLLEPVLQDVMVGFLYIPACSNFFVLAHF